MVKTVEELKYEYRNYKDPINKISRLIKDGVLFSVGKGLYETNENEDPFILAKPICQESYISFETALSYHGLIPERVYAIMSASLNKKKEKTYINQFGMFIYKCIPERVFPYGVLLVKNNDGLVYQIATKEKALCDKLYKLPPIKNYRELEDVLFNGLRIDEDILFNFDINDMKFYSEKYKSTNVSFLYRYLKRKQK